VTLRCRENPLPEPFSRLGPVRGLPASLLALALSAVAAFCLAACGGEDAKLLPGETAREITANLDTVQQLSNEGDCSGAESAVQQVGEQIEALEGVDAKLKRALEGGAARLGEVIAGCEEAATEAISPALVPTEEESEEEPPPEEKEKKETEGKPKPEEVPETESSPPSLPPQAKGEAKGHEKGVEEEGSGESDEGGLSGGVGPGSPAEADESGEGGK
jgi:hypothetical protein